MEPLTAAAIATLILTKAFEKTGETLGEGVLAQSSKLMTLLKSKLKPTATAIEQVAQQPALAEQQPANFGIAALEKQVEAAAAADPEIRAAVQAVADAAQTQPGTIVNMTRLAEKIGILIQGGYNPISIDKLEV